MKLASHLNMSVERCQQETSSTQFNDWQVYLEIDVNAFHREDFYFAQICQVIAKVFGSKQSKSISVEDFLLKFKTENKKALISMTKEQGLKITKQRWFRRVGYIFKKDK